MSQHLGKVNLKIKNMNTKMKFRHSYNYVHGQFKKDFEVIDQERLVEEGQAITIQELLQRSMQGIPPPYTEGVYMDSDDFDSIDVEKTVNDLDRRLEAKETLDKAMQNIEETLAEKKQEEQKTGKIEKTENTDSTKTE